MPNIPNEEVIYLCAEALYCIMQDAVRETDVRERLIKSLGQYDLADTPHLEINKLFKAMAETCLEQAAKGVAP